jgi:hypothetical protein
MQMQALSVQFGSHHFSFYNTESFMDLETVKNIATIGAPITSALVETWLKPNLVSLFKRRKTDSDVISESISTRFGEYLERSHFRNSHISTIVFNSSKELKDLYVPLTLIGNDRRKRDEHRVVLSEYPKDLFLAERRVLITDSAGMGKSTLMKFESPRDSRRLLSVRGWSHGKTTTVFSGSA